MVLPYSVRIPRVPTYSGFLLAPDWPFVYGAFTLFDRIFQFSSTRSSVHFSQVLTRHIFLYVVWALPISLATTFGIVFYFLFLRVIRCFSSPGSPRVTNCSLHDTATLLAVSSLIRTFMVSFVYVQLAMTFRSLSRPSSAPCTKASSLRSL